MPSPVIAVRGARTHNLKNVDADIPRGQFVVVTGPSGSGKSSFAFDTVFAEGRRRFLETLSISARQAVGQLARPDVDSVRGLPPTVAVGQALGRPTRLSTVSTLTGLDDRLRLLFTRLGTAHCPDCQTPLSTRPLSQIVDRLVALPERTKLIIYAPVVREELGHHQERLDQIIRDGFVRIRVDGQTVEAAEAGPLDPEAKHSIDIVIDRLIVKEGFELRLRESLDLAIEHGEGTCIVSEIAADRSETERFESTRFACLPCDKSYPDLDQRVLSFESPYGACVSCRGTGLRDDETTCDDCRGARLKPFGRGVVLCQRTLPEVRALQPSSLSDWFETVKAESASDPLAIAFVARIEDELKARISTLHDLGLSYLSLDRTGRTLSGGELQRTRLVHVVADRLTGVCYVLDEPTKGLHPSDTDKLIRIIERLVGGGSTVIAVEHDPDVIAAAGRVLTFGPKGGASGGELVCAEAPPDNARRRLDAEASKDSFTPQHPSTGTLIVRGACYRTLNSIDAKLPKCRLVGVAGVSGSGKTTFSRDVLAHAVRSRLQGGALDHHRLTDLEGWEEFNGVSTLDQTPAGKSPRSCPATILGIWGRVRALLARSKVARLRGFSASRFSFNSPEGQCPSCKGRGVEVVRVKFLPPAVTVCNTCHGARFEPATLSATFKQHSIADILRLTVDEACDVFENLDRIARPLELCRDAGLGYLSLGQSADTLSGGESQRLKLVETLTRKNVPTTLYILDEPTSGLAIDEVSLLVAIFRRLTAAGHTVICVEHNRTLLRACDHVLEFGPGPGADGGNIIAVHQGC